MYLGNIKIKYFMNKCDAVGIINVSLNADHKKID